MTSFRASDWTGTIVELCKQDGTVENMVCRFQRMIVIINGVLIHSSYQFGVSNIDVWTIQSNISAIFGLRKGDYNPLPLPSGSATTEYRNKRSDEIKKHISIWFHWLCFNESEMCRNIHTYPCLKALCSNTQNR